MGRAVTLGQLQNDFVVAKLCIRPGSIRVPVGRRSTHPKRKKTLVNEHNNPIGHIGGKEEEKEKEEKEKEEGGKEEKEKEKEKENSKERRERVLQE